MSSIGEHLIPVNFNQLKKQCWGAGEIRTIIHFPALIRSQPTVVHFDIDNRRSPVAGAAATQVTSLAMCQVLDLQFQERMVQ